MVVKLEIEFRDKVEIKNEMYGIGGRVIHYGLNVQLDTRLGTG